MFKNILIIGFGMIGSSIARSIPKSRNQTNIYAFDRSKDFSNRLKKSKLDVSSIKSLEDIEMLLKSGADKVSINTSAILNPDLIEEASKEYGAQCIVLAIDAKQDGKIWNVYTHGGKNRTDLDAIEWAKKGQDLGAGEILMTSMDKDGTKSGFDNNLYLELSNNLSIPVIASGGAGELSHLVDAVKLGKADALLAASIFHYEEISIKKVKQALRFEGFEVRL